MKASIQGCLIVVVGASGAGKDSIIKAARKHYQNHPRVGFVKRVITRPCNPETEVHDTLSVDDFIRAQRDGKFAVHWQANDLYYGLPISCIDDVATGKVLVANGSRAAIPHFRDVFEELIVVHITVSSDMLEIRLKRRQRESDAQIKARLARNDAMPKLVGDDVVEIDNSAAREDSIHQFTALIETRLSQLEE